MLISELQEQHGHRRLKSGISLITALKNRNESLEVSLKSWISLPEIKEIIIVDWTSSAPVKEVIGSVGASHIRLIRVEGQKDWILSKAFNLASHFVRYNQLLKTDADVRINKDFFRQHRLKKGQYFCGNWMQGRDENEKHLNGTVFLFTKDFLHVNGYNEFITSYGWDDNDLYDRLSDTGLNRFDIRLDTLSHIPHESRTSFQVRTRFLKNIPDSERANINILLNRFICSRIPSWSSKQRMSDFEVLESGEGELTCQLFRSEENPITEELNNQAELQALWERLAQLDLSINKDLFPYFTPGEVKALYYLALNPENRHDHLIHASLIRKFNYHFAFCVRHHTEIIQKLEQEADSLRYETGQKEISIKKQVSVLEKYQNQCWELNQSITELRNFITAKDQLIRQKDGELKKQVDTIHAKDEQLRNKEKLLVSSVVEIENLHKKVQGLNSQLSELNEIHQTTILDFSRKLIDNERYIQYQTSAIQHLGQDLQNSTGQIRDLGDRLTTTQSSLTNALLEVSNLEKALSASQQNIIDIKNSYSWKIGHSIMSILGKILKK